MVGHWYLWSSSLCIYIWIETSDSYIYPHSSILTSYKISTNTYLYLHIVIRFIIIINFISFKNYMDICRLGTIIVCFLKLYSNIIYYYIINTIKFVLVTLLYLPMINSNNFTAIYALYNFQRKYTPIYLKFVKYVHYLIHIIL